MTIILTSESSVSLPGVQKYLGAQILKRRFTCITTAAAIYRETPWVDSEQQILRDLGAETVAIDLSVLSAAEAAKALEQSEGIFVHGGNTFYLLQEIQRTGLIPLVRELVRSDVPYIGSSAGSLVAAPRIDVIAATDDPSRAPTVDAGHALGLVSIVPFVHFDNPSYWPKFRTSFEQALTLGINVLPLRNDQFVVVERDGDSVEKWQLFTI